jgi:hypothetical protein
MATSSVSFIANRAFICALAIPPQPITPILILSLAFIMREYDLAVDGITDPIPADNPSPVLFLINFLLDKDFFFIVKSLKYDFKNEFGSLQ